MDAWRRAEGLREAAAQRGDFEPQRMTDAELLNRELERVRTELSGLVRDFIDPDPCSFDHHGYCQTHGWFDTDPACPHGRAKRLLDETKEARADA